MKPVLLRLLWAVALYGAGTRARWGTEALTDKELADKLAAMEDEVEDIKKALRGPPPSPQAPPAPAPAPAESFWNAGEATSDRVFMFTFMDKVSNYGCASLRSAMMSGTNVTVFGLSDTLHRANGDRYHGFRYTGDKIKKVYIMHKYLELLSASGDGRDDDIIVFNDGFDVLYTPNSFKLVETFKSIEKPNTALFAAERTCFPKECKEQDDGLKKASSFKYVNSGDYIARFPVALRLLRTWVEVMRLEGGDAEDQTAVHEMILGRGNNKQEKAGPFKMETVFATLKSKDAKFEPVEIALDTGCVVFQTGMKTKLSDGTWKDAPTARDSELKQGPYLRPADGVIYNTETKSEPLFIHFNGERFWFMPVEKVFFERFVQNSQNGNGDKFKALCHKYLELYADLKQCSKFLDLDYCNPLLP